MTSPDVTVVVAVYNTMPYLTECLNSLVGQSIGLDRLEIVAVDDGSTDDSGAELDRFAKKYPKTVKVIHQANSGGPAAPSNRALEVATGRFVYFIGSDDYLGKEALARMVKCADKHDSDVVVGKMVGTNGRYVHQALYKKSNPDVSLYDSALPFTLANTKLFRRDLVERHKLRFPEDLPVGSDQPFTIEACVRARKISVLADYTYYYAVKRGDSSNITYRANHLSRLRCTARILEHAAGLIEAGPQRDTVFQRHFTWELAKLVQGDFPSLDEQTRREVCAGIAELADDYLTERLADSLPVTRRVRLTLAQRGMVDELAAAIEAEENGAPIPFHLEGDRAFAAYTGFRDPAVGIPDRIYEVLGESVPAMLAAGTELVSAEWEQSGDDLFLSVAVRTALTGDTESAVVRLVQGAMPKSADKAGGRRLPAGQELPPPVGEFSQEVSADGAGTVLRARIPVAARTATLGVRVHVDIAGWTYEIPVRAQDKPMPLARRWRSGTPYRVAARVNAKGRMVVVTGLLFPPSDKWWSRVRPLLVRVKRKVSR
ncbi:MULTISPECIES: glycosyltransferase family 2 protein [unclassified Streptomyces]|uniref:glycosyltransferase family 2 protein n=1 Tax=unclassified Streptomyces TaxID=2593676 RepID=UPI002E2B2239|nr:glycosyltransferase [Streptomyces sp. NBC_00306]